MLYFRYASTVGNYWEPSEIEPKLNVMKMENQNGLWIPAGLFRILSMGFEKIIIFDINPHVDICIKIKVP